MKHILLLLSILLFGNMLIAAPIEEFSHPKIISFEEGFSPFSGDKNSQLSTSADHYKHLQNSLQWQWQSPAAQISIHAPIGYSQHEAGSKETSVSTFIFWLYQTSPLSQEKLRFEFLKAGKVCCFFDYGLNFKGWRGAWIAFDRDMQGKPEVGMDQLRITAPNTASGKLWLDHIILSLYQDVRYHTADFQAPYINPFTDSHWLILLKSWNNPFYKPMQQTVTSDQKSSFRIIDDQLTKLQIQGMKKKSLAALQKRYDEYQITVNADGSLKGVPIFFERFGECYKLLTTKNYSKIYNNAMGLSKFNLLLRDIACTYTISKDATEREELSTMFVSLARFMLDQGFCAGSAMGTLHHLGYSMRTYYPAMFLMREPLQKAGIKKEISDAMLWFAGTGEVKLPPVVKGMDIDAFNTSLIGRLSGILMMNDTPEKVNYLQSMVTWIDNGLDYADGSMGCFKVDGSIYHHRNNYPAYAVGGLSGAVDAVWILHNTPFEISAISHQHLKDAMLMMRKYCNLLTWPLSVSGRHPDGEGKLIPAQYAQLATAGSPDKTERIDKELAAAYLRLVNGKQDKYTRQFTAAGISAETAPQGNWAMNYSSLAIHRRDNWLVTAKGFSRYIWAAETYIGADHYGRYMNHGNLQIQATGSPISVKGSGFQQEGWDWNHFPGTTATVFPMAQLKSNILNVDTCSGFEEMLLSDESYAGALTLQNRQGMYAMKLHENDKYNGSLRARKSYFFFDNRVVALGSNIESAVPNTPTQTTLFQNHLPQVASPISIQGKEVSDFPYHQLLSQPYTALGDGLNNYFYVKNGSVEVTRSRQHSLHEETDEPTEGDFSLAVIDHGNAPKGAKYEYMVLIQPTAAAEATCRKAMAKNNGTPYCVYQQDSLAHIVYDKATKITAYALFEAGKINTKTPLLSVDIPALVMIDESDSKMLSISVCDPDLHFYEGKSDDIYDAHGKSIERSIYSRNWIDNPSAPSVVRLELKGKWQVSGENPYISVVSVTPQSTTINVNCQHGLSREAKLLKIKK